MCGSEAKNRLTTVNRSRDKLPLFRLFLFYLPMFIIKIESKYTDLAYYSSPGHRTQNISFARRFKTESSAKAAITRDKKTRTGSAIQYTYTVFPV